MSDITASIMIKNLDTNVCNGWRMTIPDSILEARVRIQAMIDQRYDGLCQKPEVLNHLSMIVVVYDTGRIGDPEDLLQNVQAAALNTSVVAH